MGLHVYVYRTGERDCTLGGISSKAERLCLVNVSGPFEPDADHPAAMLLRNTALEGERSRAAKIVPAVQLESGEWVKDPRWMMMGGNYAASSDSRFGEALRAIIGSHAGYAVPIHDRHEG